MNAVWAGATAPLGRRTPDGARYSAAAVRAALKGIVQLLPVAGDDRDGQALHAVATSAGCGRPVAAATAYPSQLGD
jgi:hypothetical protein